MKVDKEGVYKSKDGKEYDVVDVGVEGHPYFRAYWNGGYYNVNKEEENFPFDQIEIEMVEFVRDLNK